MGGKNLNDIPLTVVEPVKTYHRQKAKRLPIEVEVMNLGEQLDSRIEKYIYDHAYTDKKYAGAILGAIIGFGIGFLIFGLIKMWYYGFIIGKIIC